MTIINGHYDGKRVVLDDPVPTDIPADTPVRVVFDNGEVRDLFAELGRLAVATDELPADYAAQHEHYVKGTPRR